MGGWFRTRDATSTREDVHQPLSARMLPYPRRSSREMHGQSHHPCRLLCVPSFLPNGTRLPRHPSRRGKAGSPVEPTQHPVPTRCKLRVTPRTVKFYLRYFATFLEFDTFAPDIPSASVAFDAVIRLIDRNAASTCRRMRRRTPRGGASIEVGDATRRVHPARIPQPCPPCPHRTGPTARSVGVFRPQRWIGTCSAAVRGTAVRAVRPAVRPRARPPEAHVRWCCCSMAPVAAPTSGPM